jgi:hypothetical protein
MLTLVMKLGAAQNKERGRKAGVLPSQYYLVCVSRADIVPYIRL